MHRCLRPLVAALVALTAAAASAAAAPPPDQTSPLPNPTGCDSIDASACMLPFPNDLFTKADPTAKTGRRLDFNVLAMPKNIAGKPIDPTDWNRSDGFSPGSPIVTKITGLDEDAQLDTAGAPRIWDPEFSLSDASAVTVVDADTGARQMVWAELDHSMDKLGATPAQRVLVIRPAKNFAEGHRYIVALRFGKLGKAITVDPTFEKFRTPGAALGTPFDEQRRAHFEDLFKTLAADGIKRADLTQAWDFTVGSADSIAGRMLHIRDDAFAQLGDHDLSDLRVDGRAPTFTLHRVEDTGCKEFRDANGLGQDLIAVDAECPGGEDGPIAYDVKGTMLVPCYMTTPGCTPTHSHFLLNPLTGLPQQIPGNTMKVDFRCRVPKVALEHPGEARPSLYGHGLFGGYGEIGQGQLKNMMAEHNFIYCATNWVGMATEDVPNALHILTDLSNFNTLGDRVQQGMLNFLYLGRLMIHPEGLISQPEFQTKDGRPLIDTHRLYYDGNSQGGIIGGALTAVAPDFTRATLGVLGMNYSTLLNRSTDFGDGTSPLEGGGLYAYPMYQSYPQANERQLLFSIIQILWDRAEPDGYAQHMTTQPYRNTPAHRVMLMAGYGDHQVSNVTAEVEARTVGAYVLKRNMLRPWRTWELDPWEGLEALNPGEAGKRDVSVFTVWDGGSRPAPLNNTAPTNAKDDDPHEWVRNTFAARAMKSYFLADDSRVVDTCGGFCDTDSRSKDYDTDIKLDPLAGIRR